MNGLPVPPPDDLTGPFWDACAAGRLVLPRCANGHRFFVPEPVCPQCLTADWAWVPATGRGELYSWTVVHRAPAPDVPVPYVIGVVDLDEGWTLMTHLVDVDEGDLRAGLRLAVHMTPRDGVLLPTFTREETPV